MLRRKILNGTLCLLVYLTLVQLVVFIGQRLDHFGPQRHVPNSTTGNWRREYSPQTRIMKMMDLNPRPDATFHFNFRGCQYNNCAETYNPEEADLLMINGARLSGVSLPKRPEGQIWLMYTKEPMTDVRFNLLNQTSLRGQFNWTRTYLRDSTFQSVYGGLRSRDPPEKDYEMLYRKKKYDVAWFVSHCETSSRRELYVRRMATQVQIHIYGKCGNYTCGTKGYTMGGRKDQCLRMLSRDYKFYLSFENSFCRQYVTEKFFNLFPEIDVIPVVRGGADYKRLAPPGIYIDSQDFESPEKLGRYLHELSRDSVKYTGMLKKKNRYEKYQPRSDVFCHLCRAVHTRRPVHVYDDIFSWIKRPGNCWEPSDI